MAKKKILSQVARENMQLLDYATVERIKSGDWRSSPSSLLRCVVCKKHRITTPIVLFYGCRGDLLTCYECQRKARVNSYNNQPVPIADILQASVNH